jgi:hypothetical protein
LRTFASLYTSSAPSGSSRSRIRTACTPHMGI